MTLRTLMLTLAAAAILSLDAAAAAAAEVNPHWKAHDLNPVTFKAAPDHAPVVLVAPGQTGATIAVMGPNDRVARDLENYAKKTMLGRMANDNDLKGVVVFLASDAAAYITGVTVPVDAGYTAK